VSSLDGVKKGHVRLHYLSASLSFLEIELSDIP